MNTKRNIRKAAIVLLLVTGIQVVYAAFSFTGIADEKAKSSKYSLKNLSSLSHKGLSFSAIRFNLDYKGIRPSSASKETAEGIEVNSMMRFNNGHTTYVYPYTFKVKVPKFKTPSPQQR